jgi:hypothetical protein
VSGGAARQLNFGTRSAALIFLTKIALKFNCLIFVNIFEFLAKSSVSALVPPTAVKTVRFDAPKMAQNRDFRQNRAIREIK